MFLRLLILGFVSLLALPAEESARSLAKQAAKAEKAGRLADAILLYNRAEEQDPKNRTYGWRARALTERAVSEMPAAAPLKAAEPVVSSVIPESDFKEARQLLPPPELTVPPGPFDISLRGEPKTVIEETAKKLGIAVQIDNDFPSSGQPVRFVLGGATGPEVLEALGAATGTFFVPLSRTRMLVAKDTQQKRQELEPTVAVVLSLPEPASVQEAQELGRAVQQTMELQKFAIDNGRRLVLMRDKISKVRPAQAIFEQMLGARPAVAIEMEVHEIRRNRGLQAGVRLPSATEIFNMGRNPLTGETARIRAIPLSAVRFLGSSLLGLTLADAAVVASLSTSLGTQKQRVEVRTMHGMPVQLAVGEKYPILTAGFFGGTITDTTYRPPPTFQFENLGLTLKATPFTHGLDDISIEIEAEFKLLTGAKINGIPVLSNRKFNSTVRLTNGEWAMLAGVGSYSRTETRSGPPLLMQIPYLGALFRTSGVDYDETDTLVLLRPRLLALPPSEGVTRAIRIGSESHPRMPQ